MKGGDIVWRFVMADDFQLVMKHKNSVRQSCIIASWFVQSPDSMALRSPNVAVSDIIVARYELIDS